MKDTAFFSSNRKRVTQTAFLGQALLLLAVMGALTSSAFADPVFENFIEDVVGGTVTLESSSGTTLSTEQFAVWGTEIPPDIASQIETGADPGSGAFFSSSATESFIQSSASEAALTTDLAFLINDGNFVGDTALPGVGVISANPSPYVQQILDVFQFVQALFPAYTTTSDNISPTFTPFSYTTATYESPTMLIEGTVTFDFFQQDLTLQPTTIPEPAPAALILAGIVALLGIALRKRREQRGKS
ncbi:MAG TPA: PEP-CTERM sorting domain-containing protein [Tepidisphaeraceae bacterium]|jgi:hypothetical protein